jgi:hypothetical protein
MIPAHALGYAATVVVSAAAGWVLHAPGTASTSPAAPTTMTVAPRPAAAPRPATGTAAPLIAVASDGTVTLRVEQQPLEWVLEQIAQQSGWSDVRARAIPAAASAAPSPAEAGDTACPEPVILSPADARRRLQAIEHGSESDRFDGLLQAGAEGAVVPDAMLKTIVETDASDRVRLLAFEHQLGSHSGEPSALRAALEAALYVPSAAIQREAQRRLDELRESEQIDAASAQGASP